MSTNITLQDFTGIIHRTSLQNGGKFDIIHVETLIQTDEPISSDNTWYIPNSKKIDPMFQDIFKHTHTNPQPIPAELLSKRIEDFSDAIVKAEEGNMEETKEDVSTLALLHVLSKTTLKPIEDTTNTYILSYDYKLFPVEPNIFELKVKLPFDGFVMPDNGDEIQITIVTPIGASIIEEETKGIDLEDRTISPQLANFTNSRKQAVSFQYSTDPEFTIKYKYQ